MADILDGTKELLNAQYKQGTAFCSGKPFSKYQKVYFATNENIKEYLNKNNLEGKTNALTVMASGDHSFNLIEKGILNIDTFDTNALTEFYVLGIKCAMIMRYSYKEYLITLNKLLDINTSLDEVTSILTDLFPYMDYKYREYWREIVDYNYSVQTNNNTNINLFNLLFINVINSKKLIERNNYLKDEETYNKFKNNLKKSNITFKNINALDLSKEYKNKYDILLLSNIVEYLQYQFGRAPHKVNYIKDYSNELFSIMNEDSKIFFMYIFNYATELYTREKILPFSNITSKDLNVYEILEIDSCSNKKIKDGVLILKK